MDEKIIEGLKLAAFEAGVAETGTSEVVAAILTALAELTPSLRTQEEVRRILGLTGEDA